VFKDSRQMRDSKAKVEASTPVWEDASHAQTLKEGGLRNYLPDRLHFCSHLHLTSTLEEPRHTDAPRKPKATNHRFSPKNFLWKGIILQLVFFQAISEDSGFFFIVVGVPEIFPTKNVSS